MNAIDAHDEPVPGPRTSNAGQTTADAFLGDRLKIRQSPTAYRAGLDAVVLAASVHHVEPGTFDVLDMGAGVGTVGLCVAARCAGARVLMVEQAPAFADLARQNIAANHLADRVSIITHTIGGPLAAAPDLAARRETFDHVLANPPYFDAGSGTRATDPLKAVAHAMDKGGLEAWARFAATMVRSGGMFTLIHRAEALTGILAVTARRFGALTVLPLHTRSGAPATRVVVRGVKGSRAPLSLLPGRDVHSADGKSFTAEFEAILRDGAALTW